ncbi:30S ribosomal protein S7 [Striga asiatica]|uniref:30S ribosomal protein S7 n=1 Tax=Striga asiatica TaxID=4170 RepID=A0A5A7PX13_STRAF|nr:30S ribosomal protein S7 [Striga asiatica]
MGLATLVVGYHALAPRRTLSHTPHVLNQSLRPCLLRQNLRQLVGINSQPHLPRPHPTVVPLQLPLRHRRLPPRRRRARPSLQPPVHRHPVRRRSRGAAAGRRRIPATVGEEVVGLARAEVLVVEEGRGHVVREHRVTRELASQGLRGHGRAELHHAAARRHHLHQPRRR